MTNDDSKRTTDELKDVAAGQRQLTTPDSGAGTPPGSTPDAGDGRVSIDDLSGAVGASRTVVSNQPVTDPPGNNPNPPGQGLGVDPLENLVAGRGRTQTTPGGAPDATPDPGNDGPPQSIGGGTDISQIPNQSG